MSKIKKLILGLGAIFTIVVASVITFACINPQKNAIGVGHYKNIGEEVIIDDNLPIPNQKPSTITYKAGSVSVQKGADSINYNYSPDVNSQSSNVIAYEYMFASSMDRVAINIKSIDTTGVNVSYKYSLNQRLDTSEEIVGQTNFELQQIVNTSDILYVYILVSPEDANAVVSFSTKIVWWYGVPKTVKIYNNLTNEVIDEQVIVSGQTIDKNSFKVPTAPEGYYFDAWFNDAKFTSMVEGETGSSGKMYARFANLPSDYLALDTTTDTYYVTKGTSSLNNTLVIPNIYNGKKVTCIEDVTSSVQSAFYCLPLTQVNLPITLTSIGSYAFHGCDRLKSVNFKDLINLDIIKYSAFGMCPNLYFVHLPENLTTVETYAFSADVISLVLPKSLTTIQDRAFDSPIAEIYNLSNINLVMGSYDYGRVALYTRVIHDSLDDNSRIELIDNVYYYKQNQNELIAIGVEDRVDVTSITLDERTVELGNAAFEYCHNLTNINIPEGVTKIGDACFWRCHLLNNIVLPSTVTFIETYAFAYCIKLTSIIIPSNVNKIGQQIFAECNNLATVTFEDTSGWYKTDNYYNWRDMTTGTEISSSYISDPSNNTTLFLTSGELYDYYMFKK